MKLALRFLGVGGALGGELGSSAAVLERDGQDWLAIDCGPGIPLGHRQRYGRLPLQLFITHAHLDHIGGMEALFAQAWFAEPRIRPRLFVPVPIIGLLHQRLADYPGTLAEGGVNWWDAFELIPVSRGFWLDGVWFDVFETRHHEPGSAYGLALRGRFVFSGDTRPIPERIVQLARSGETVFHECGLRGNPSHTGIEDLLREYPAALRQRMVCYHYASAADRAAFEARGLRCAVPGEAYALPEAGAG